MGDTVRDPTFDKDGYPTEETLQAIKEWERGDLGGLFDFARRAWNNDFGDWHGGSNALGGHAKLSTGGWSGNEDIIAALQANTMAWTLAWWSSRRGGHYEFRW